MHIGFMAPAPPKKRKTRRMIARSLLVPVVEEKISTTPNGLERGEPEETAQDKLDREAGERLKLAQQSAQHNMQDILRWLRQEMNRRECSYAKLSAVSGVSESAIKSWYRENEKSRRNPGLLEIMKCLQALNFVLIPTDGFLYLDDKGERHCNPIDWFRHHLANRELQDTALTRATSITEEHERSNKNALRMLKAKTHKPRTRIF